MRVDDDRGNFPSRSGERFPLDRGGECDGEAIGYVLSLSFAARAPRWYHWRVAFHLHEYKRPNSSVIQFRCNFCFYLLVKKDLDIIATTTNSNCFKYKKDTVHNIYVLTYWM